MTAMTKSTLGFWRAYRLRPVRSQADDVVSQLRVDGAGSSQTVLLPYSGRLGYFIVPTAGVPLSIAAGEDFCVESLDFLTSLWVRLRLALLIKKKKYLKFAEFSLFCYGVKLERKRFTTFNQHMFNTGVALDGDLVTRHPELLTGWPEIEPKRTDLSPGSSNPAAIVVHLYYEDTWTDIAEVLKRLTIPFDLVVTTVPQRERLIETVRRDFPHADIEVMENRGRDVRPFLALLEQGRFDRYRYLCKIHGKKSNDGGRMSYMGSLWRRRLLFDLLAAPGLAQAIIDRFERNASIGMIGPRAFRMPSATYSEDLSWSVNRSQVLKLAEKMGVPAERFRLDFFGGTMFWVRPEALEPLRRLRVASAFPEERGLLDGGLEHAAERLFGTSVVAAGYTLEECEGASAYEDESGIPSVRDGSQQLRSR
jgi:hypothetical protein